MKIFRISTLAATASLLAVTACTSIDTPTGNPRTRTNEGIALGAATGVVLGLLGGRTVKERRNSALVGGVLGGALGGAVGAKLDQQAADLQASLGDGRIQVINQGDYLIVRMPEDILFAVDSAVVQPALRPDLAAVAANLNRYPGSTIEVVGHTDRTGPADYNLALSQRRARAVADILIAEGVSAGRVRAIGKGEDEPIATNYTPQGRAQNRRVEILIRPSG